MGEPMGQKSGTTSRVRKGLGVPDFLDAYTRDDTGQKTKGLPRFAVRKVRGFGSHC